LDTNSLGWGTGTSSWSADGVESRTVGPRANRHVLHTEFQITAMQTETRQTAYLVALCCLLLVPLASGITEAARSGSARTEHSDRQKQPHTVVDYYLLLPTRYFEREDDGQRRPKDRLESIQESAGGILDIKNGYLYAKGDGAQPDLSVCVFKRPDKTYLVAVSHSDADYVFDPFLDFYAYENGRLRDVTKATLPVAIRSELLYELPRFGTTIHVTRRNGKRMYDLVWYNGRFRVRRPGKAGSAAGR
jgi:hypothetical protein